MQPSAAHRFGFQISDLFPISDFGFRISSFPTLLAVADDERIPPLQPPRGLIPPDAWEQYGVWFVLGGILGLLLIAAILWLLLRPRPPVPIPLETQARRLLEALRQEPETGSVLSRVSHAVRAYFAAAFGLPEGELTTSEFCRALNAVSEPGPELKARVSGFLRDCDERKFSPTPGPSPLGAAAQALTLIEQAEARRAQLRIAALSGPGSSSSEPQSQTASPAAPGSTAA